jgi:hypothetical protein
MVLLNAKFSSLAKYTLNLLFILAAATICFELAKILLSNTALDEKAIQFILLPAIMLIFSLIFLASSKSKGKSMDSNAIKGVVSEISEFKGKNGLTYFKLKINNQTYEVPFLPETYYLVNTHKGERVSIPLTQDLRKYLRIIN